MHYIDTPEARAPQPRAAQPAPNGADKFYGKVASGYDDKRVNDPKWITEQKIITDLLADMPAGSVVLDCPVGTGRFLPFYVDKGFTIIGIDKSADMLNEAAKKVDPKRARGYLELGDVRKLALPDKSVDAAVACRITRWLSPDDCVTMMKELQRVCKKRIIWTARIANHTHARSVALFESALLPGWKIVQNIPGYVMDYRILCAERVGL